MDGFSFSLVISKDHQDHYSDCHTSDSQEKKKKTIHCDIKS